MSIIHDTALLEVAMRRALAVAAAGPAGDPNPQVGCVILAPTGAIVAEGYHRGAGTAHAEVDALHNLNDSDRRRAAELTAVVTLEPCAHTGRTGPCAQAFIDAGIGAVVYALADPTPTAGGGAAILRAAGIPVLGGILAAQARNLLSPWLARQQLRRPHVTVKWAQSLDGRAAASNGSSQWITGEQARADAHRLRASCDAIAVGTGTVLVDDPALTARGEGGRLLPEQPLPVVWGARSLPEGAKVNQHPAVRKRGLQGPLRYPGADLRAELADLRTQGVRRLFVEGGPTLISAFIAVGLVDEVVTYIAPALLGGPHTALGAIGVASMEQIHRLQVGGYENLGGDLKVLGHPTRKDETCLPD